MINSTGNNAIDSLLAGSYWVSQPRSAATITYSFMTQVPAGASADDAKGFQPMTAAEKSAAVTSLASWANVANVTFSQVSDSGTGGQIRLGTNDQGSTSSGYANYPDSSGSWLFLSNTASTNTDFTPGSYGLSTMVHELGHALGLKHPGNYNAGDSSQQAGPFLPAATDNTDYTIMSYNDGPSTNALGTWGAGPMLYDIQALQYIYGANTTYHTGNDTYSFTSSNIPICVWDAGGTNTFDFSKCSQGVIVDLRQGHFSSTSTAGGATGNISIAFGTVIQNVVGGNGGGTIYGNANNDHLTGGAGHYIFVPGGGVTVIDGTGAGQNDVIQFTNASNQYSLSLAGGAIVINQAGGGQGDGLVTATNVTTLQFTDKAIAVSSITAPVIAAVPTVVVTMDGNRFTTDGDGAAVARIYQAAFNRQPDSGGIQAWTSAYKGSAPIADRAALSGPGGNFQALAADPLSSGVSLAYGFTHSDEFISRYGSLTDNSAFVTQIYQNVLHRTPDSAGLSAWVNAANSGLSHEAILVGFALGTENVSNTAGWILT